MNFFQTCKGIAKYLYPYIRPSYNNIYRSTAFLSSTIIIPVLTVATPFIFFKKIDNVKEDEQDFTNNFVFPGIIMLLKGLQQGMTTVLQMSITQAIRKNNVKKFMDDEAKFLIYGDTSNISSIQYVTVGQGVHDFGANTLAVVSMLPSTLISTISTLVYIAILTNSTSSIFIVLGCCGFYFITMLTGLKAYYGYEVRNQEIENFLVGEINEIEANKKSISLAGAERKESERLFFKIQNIDGSIIPMGIVNTVYYFARDYCNVIASRFFGTFITNLHAENNVSSFNQALNIMLMSTLIDLNNLAVLLTNNFPYVTLNLNQLKWFESSYLKCSALRKNNNNLEFSFNGDKIVVEKFCVELEQNDIKNSIFLNVDLILPSNKIYKLKADSGRGKTTFLNAITNNGLYTKGKVIFPAEIQNNIYYIPQRPYLPKAESLFKILTYFVEKADCLNDNYIDALKDEEDSIMLEPLIMSGRLKTQAAYLNAAKYMLEKVGLLNYSIKLPELLQEGINWEQRLSGGEKQKIVILMNILSMVGKPGMLILDEATSALDFNNRQIVYSLIKEYINQENCQNFIIIYTDHANYENFADHILHIQGQSVTDSVSLTV